MSPSKMPTSLFVDDSVHPHDNHDGPHFCICTAGVAGRTWNSSTVSTVAVMAARWMQWIASGARENADSEVWIFVHIDIDLRIAPSLSASMLAHHFSPSRRRPEPFAKLQRKFLPNLGATSQLQMLARLVTASTTRRHIVEEPWMCTWRFWRSLLLALSSEACHFDPH